MRWRDFGGQSKSNGEETIAESEEYHTIRNVSGVDNRWSRILGILHTPRVDRRSAPAKTSSELPWRASTIAKDHL